MKEAVLNETRDRSPLRLMLFVTHRAKADPLANEIRQALLALAKEECFHLEVIQISDQPFLVEYFRLVAVPALVKTYPEPVQVFTGSHLIQQLSYWWPRWQLNWQDTTPTSLISAELALPPALLPPGISARVLQLSDEVFRLKQENEALQSRLRFRDRIIAMLAHDLRSPLTTAALAMETIEAGFNQADRRLPEATVSQLLRQSRSQLRKLDDMLNEMLQAACGEEEEFFIQPQQLDLQQLCHEVVSQLTKQIAARSQTLILDIPTDLPLVCADPQRIRQVLLNLFDNAIKYTPQGGELSLACLHRTSQKVQVSLCDTGPGIPEEAETIIFDDTFRLPRDYKTDGYGIGLSVCRRIIRAHYGQIWVSPRQPQGSCFHFTVPVLV